MRHLLMCFAALIAFAAGGFTAAAQDAIPAATDSPLAALGYPELRIVATDEGAEVPREVAAGRLLVVLENQGTPDGPAAVSDVNILQLPPGVTLDDLNALLQTEGAPLPDWFGDIDSAGGFNVAAGQTGYAVLDLEPGEWSIAVGDTGLYAPLTVTADPVTTPAASADPPADVTIEQSDFAFDLPDQLPAGRQV